ncbi:hypothetical protein [Ruminococcus sp.]|uniref:hypothetical protein n=1 Tax=Ruminococcus sp. TaxID=41978 RepID=UPI0025DC3998|nr:hypothetical protein [Ruminococcus sp.]MCI6616450.1 hypothetical protein [Ruminococcus sp.]
MKINNIFSKLFCAILIIFMCVASTACSSSPSSTESKVPADGYQLPYEYSDGYTAKLKTTDDTTYLVTSTDLIGNKVVHFKTDKSEDEVKKYYDDYFANLEEVKLKNEKDKTTGYFDKDKRLIMYNLVVWSADGKTNYKLSCEACDNISESKNWEAK